MQSLANSSPDHTARLRSAILAALAYLGLYTAWLALGAGSEGERLLVGNLALVFPGLTSAILARRIANNLTSARLRRAWMLFGAGLLLWTASDLFWMLTEMVRLPFGQILTDGVHLAGYVAMMAGLLVYPYQMRRSFTHLRLIMEMAISSAAVLTLGWLVLVQPILASTPLHRDLQFWSAVYPLADLILIVMLLNIFLLTHPDRLDNAIKWIGLGLAALTASDLVYSFWILQNPYLSGGWMDLGWTAGTIAIGLGALEPVVPQISDLASELPDRFIRFRRNLEDRLQSSLPLVTTFALGWYTVLAWQIRGRIDNLGLAMTVVLVLGLVARQGVAAGETELQKYAMLVSSIAEPAFICNSKGKLKLVNPALLASTGHTHNSPLLEQPILNLFDLASLPDGLLQTSLSQGWSGEVRLRRYDGSTFPVYLSLRPIQRFSGERLALAGTAHDLTEQKNQQAALKSAYEQIAAAHRQLEALNEQLEQKVNEKTQNLSEAYTQLEQQNRSLQMLDELKSDFVSLVSHELRAPLTNISGGIELVLNRPRQLPAEVKQSLTLVQVEIRRLSHFVESILDLSALDAGRTPLYPAPLHLTGILQPMLRQLLTIPNAPRVDWQIPSNLPLVLADDRALASIFFHLIDNAAKYAPQGKITVKAWSENQQVYVQVADHGPGIPPEALPLIFDKFYRFHYGDAQQVYGHGLGLYIVRRLLQTMNGDIRVENLDEGGAAFTFWLPTIEE